MNLKIVLWSGFALALVLLLGGGLFVYKIKNGFPVRYETDRPVINFPAGQPALLLFSKTTGYRHSESIQAAKKVFQQMANQNGWFIYETEEGGVFNAEQLKNFKIIVINNATGRLLNAEQQHAVSRYVESGGALMGIHGSGDFSHDDWPWLNKNLVGATFSHHPLHPQLQAAEVHMEKNADATLSNRLPASWNHSDEWYIYFSQPKNVQIVAYIDGNRILPSGNVLFVRGKNFGMGKYHPVAWHRKVGLGKTFYTSMGHDAAVWQDTYFVNLLENAVRWSIERDPDQAKLSLQP